MGRVDYRDDVAHSRSRAEQTLETEARRVYERLNDGIAVMIRDADLIARLSATVPGAAANLDSLLRTVIERDPAYSEIELITSDGRASRLLRVHRHDDGMVSESATANAGPDLPNEELASLSPGTWSFRPGNEPATVDLVMRVMGPQGANSAYVAITSDLEKMVSDILGTMMLPQPTVVLDAFGHVLASRIPPASPGGPIAVPIDLILPIDRKERTFALTEHRENVFGSIFEDSDSTKLPGIGVVVAQPDAQMSAAAHDAARRSLVFGGISTFLSCLVAGSFAIWITRPLVSLSDSLQRYDGHGPLDRLPVTLKDEVGDVARGFVDLVNRLRRSESRAIAIVESLNDALIVIDRSGTILEFSGTAEETFGHVAREVIGEQVGILMPEPHRSRLGRYLARFRSAAGGHATDRTLELEGVRASGEIFPIELTISVLRSEAGDILIGTIRDITERKRADAIRSAFVSTMNFELRTPLTSVQAALALLERHEIARADARSSRLLQIARGSCNRLMGLIDDILDLEQIEAGNVEYRPEIVDLSRLLAEIVEEQRPLAERYEVEFAFDDCGVNGTVLLDRSRFNLALSNVLSNAARYSPAHDRVELCLTVPTEGIVRINVADHGPGIPVHFREKVFERFTQAEEPRSARRGTSGLGLAIAKSIVEAAGGRIGFTTELGRGTTFHIDLPCETQS
jgi:PAS domain S-box-containing protein